MKYVLHIFFIMQNSIALLLKQNTATEMKNNSK